MDVGQIEAAITARTRCIIPVHLFGQCADMDAVQTIADRHGIPTLEDCAQSTGAGYRAMLLLKLKWATARPIRSARDLARVLQPQALYSNR